MTMKSYLWSTQADIRPCVNMDFSHTLALFFVFTLAANSNDRTASSQSKTENLSVTANMHFGTHS